MLNRLLLLFALVSLSIPSVAFEPDPNQETLEQMSLLYTCAYLYKNNTAQYENAMILEHYANDLGKSIGTSVEDRLQMKVNAELVATHVTKDGVPFELALLCANMLGEVQARQ